jgi:hypothetical protein
MDVLKHLTSDYLRNRRESSAPGCDHQ